MATKKKTSWFLAILFIFFAHSFTAAEEPKGEVKFCSLVGSWATRIAYDPHSALGGSSRSLITLVFDGLITKDDQGIERPALAKSWKIARDWSAVDFRLHKGVTFHNGDPLTAKDVKFSIERAMREDLQFVFGAEFRRHFKSIEIVNDHAIRINLKTPFPGILDRLQTTAIVPKSYIEKIGDAGFAAKPVGAGPFRVVKFSRDHLFEVEAVQNHYRKTPSVKKFSLLNLSEPSTRMAKLMTGEADVVCLQANYIPTVKKDPNLKIFWSRHTYLMTLVFFDLAHPENTPFKDARVRRAASLAIDRKGITDALGHGAWEPWGSCLAPYHPGFDANRNIPDPYDPAKARKLLAEAGYANGFDTVLVAHPNYRKAFEAIQQQLAEVGIRAKMEVPEHGTHASMFTAGKLRGIGTGTGPYWSGISHPGVAIQTHVTGSWVHTPSTPAMKKAMDSLMNAIGDKAIAERARELDKLWLKEIHRVPLWSISQAFGARAKILEFPTVPGLQHPMGFEFLKIKDK